MKNYILVKRPEDISEYLPPLSSAKVIAVDTETTGLDPHLSRLRLVQLAIEGLSPIVIDCDTFLPNGSDILREILSTSAVKVFQNAGFDLQFLTPLGIDCKPIFDTMLAGKLLYLPGIPRSVSLESLVSYYLGEEIDKSEQVSNWEGDLTLSQYEYAAKDALILLNLRKAMVPKLIDAGLTKIAEIEFHCVRAVAQMQYSGIDLDLDRWSVLTKNTEHKRDEALNILYAYTGAPLVQTTLYGEDVPLGQNFESNPFVLKVLRDNGIDVKATSKRDLYPYRDNPLVKGLTDYRVAVKALSSFLYPIPEMLNPVTKRLHPHYGQLSAYSGRMSCYNPNIQQIPRAQEFRECFTAPVGRKLCIADYSQIELRVAAQISGDERMKTAYEHGEDLHLLTASLISDKPKEQIGKWERQAAKAVNFGLIYGMGANGLQQYASQSYGVNMSEENAAEFHRRFFQSYPGIKRWHDNIMANHTDEGRTLTGRRYALSNDPGLPGLSNTPVQGTAADIFKLALGNLVDAIKPFDAKIIAAVHDEILVECLESEAEDIKKILRQTMETAGSEILPDIPVLAEANICDDWAEK